MEQVKVKTRPFYFSSEKKYFGRGHFVSRDLIEIATRILKHLITSSLPAIIATRSENFLSTVNFANIKFPFLSRWSKLDCQVGSLMYREPVFQLLNSICTLLVCKFTKNQGFNLSAQYIISCWTDFSEKRSTSEHSTNTQESKQTYYLTLLLTHYASHYTESNNSLGKIVGTVLQL